jgi:hypothetical protein
MRKRFVYCTVLLAMLARISVAANHVPSPREHLDALKTATSLDGADLLPWHLVMSYEMNDLDGNHMESGTIEEWWASPKQHSMLITRPGLQTTTTTSARLEAGDRASYLISTLLSQVMHPVPDFGKFDGLAVQEESAQFGKTKLSCMRVMRDVPNAPSLDVPAFCVDPGTNMLRVHFDSGGLSMVRNQPATFQGKSVAVDNSIAYGGHIAITGHVTKLETFHPDADAAQERDGGAPASVPQSVVAGSMLKQVSPDYPAEAKMRHLSGTVVFIVKISVEGTIDSLEPVYMTDKVFLQPSMKAVKQWTYKPYLLNGEPTEVISTITVNFTLNR